MAMPRTGGLGERDADVGGREEAGVVRMLGGERDSERVVCVGGEREEGTGRDEVREEVEEEEEDVVKERPLGGAML